MPALIGANMLNVSAQPSPKAAELERAEKIGRAHLATFDTLDFDVFSNQEWSRLHESHSHDVKVHWPDGHVTDGIDVHIADLKKLFVYAPDTRIKSIR